MSELPAALFLPLGHLLLRGGDSRLTISGPDRVNVYGCRVEPWPELTSFSSSTASTISEHAFEQAERARQDLIDSALAIGVSRAFNDRMEEMRKALKALLLLPPDSEIVFTPSGSDAQLAALFATRAGTIAPVTTVILGADETGSGTVMTARGLHFGSCTAFNAKVEKGAAITGLAEGVEAVAIGMKDAHGRLYDLSVIDAQVEFAVEDAVGRGRRVLLKAMDSSKFGWRAPSQGCLARMRLRWPHQVQIVVDACQARLGTARLSAYVERGDIVLLTGSKFFTGPPFSGAVIIPAELAGAVAGACVPPGLNDYFTCSDWPLTWTALRAQLHSQPNLGAWLRWEAALSEMHAYYAVPQTARHHILKSFGDAVAEHIRRSASLELLPAQPRDGSDGIDDEEFALRTIFAFYLRKDGRTLGPDDCAMVYRAMQKDVSSELPAGAADAVHGLARKLCHIGQPVALPDPSGAPTAALRISASARLVRECFSFDRSEMQSRICKQIAHATAALDKVELLISRLCHSSAKDPS